MLRLNKKATEKPIEIFVALFIILAVSMIMLKMFQGQITEKTSEMKDMQRESDLERKLGDAKILCRGLCSDAAQDGCPDRAVAAYCMRKFDELDLNGDLETDGYDKSLMAGIGVCEDSVYCPMIAECKCNKDLDLKTCRDSMCKYWFEQGIGTATDASERTAMLQKAYSFGSCTMDTDSWENKLFSGGLECPTY